MSRNARMSHEAEEYTKTRSQKQPLLMDHVRAVVTFKRVTYDVMDNKSAVSLSVERTRANGKLVIRYETRDGTARSEENYVGGTGALVFTHGEKVASIEIGLHNTDFEEGETCKTFTVKLLEGSIIKGKARRLYTLKSPVEAEVRIWDNGEPADEDGPTNVEDISKYKLEMKGKSVEDANFTCKQKVLLCWMFGESPMANMSPAGHFYLSVHDVVGLVMIFYTATVTPYQLAFLVEDDVAKISEIPQASPLFWIDRMVDIYFIVDIFLNFVRPIADQGRGVDIVHMAEIRKAYLNSWFPMDVMSTVPFDILAIFFKGFPANLKAVRMLRLLRLMKLARMLRAQSTLQAWQNKLNITFTAIELIKIVVVILFTSHWMACLWGMTATSEWPGYTPEVDWIDTIADVATPSMGKTAHGQYISALYFAVMTLTTVGYGDIHAITDVEHLVVIVFMLTGGIIWAYLIGVLTSIVTNLDRHGTHFKQVMDELNYMIGDQDLPEELATRIRSYWRAVQHLTRHQAYEELKSYLSPQLQGELAYYAGSERYQSVYYLSALSDEMLLMLANLCSMDKRLYAPGEKIYERQTLCIVINNGQIGVSGKIMSLNDSWGQDFILENPLLRKDTMALTLTYSEVETVTLEKLNQVLSVHVSEKRLVGRARARLALIRGLPRLAKLLKTVEVPSAPGDLRREGLRLLGALSNGDEEYEQLLLEQAARFHPRSEAYKNPYRNLKVDKQLAKVEAEVGTVGGGDAHANHLVGSRPSVLTKRSGSGLDGSDFYSDHHGSGQTTAPGGLHRRGSSWGLQQGGGGGGGGGGSAVVAGRVEAQALAAAQADLLGSLKRDGEATHKALKAQQAVANRQAQRISEVSAGMADLREAMSMILTAQVKILDALSAASAASPPVGADPFAQQARPSFVRAPSGGRGQTPPPGRRGSAPAQRRLSPPSQRPPPDLM